MRNGIPSGKSEADVLNEVRKEAFYLKGKSAIEDPPDDQEDALNFSISSLLNNIECHIVLHFILLQFMLHQSNQSERRLGKVVPDGVDWLGYVWSTMR